MPRLSVVVPVFDVEAYLAPCLQSLARQTMDDLEVVLVDDGSTDRSLTIAEEFVAGDRRFRLLRQGNAGLGAARNAGTAAASGELLAFADSDDVLPHDAYARLLHALDAGGADFATGNVQRLTGDVVTQAQFLARTFARSRRRAHVTRFAPLLADRTAWNKVFRRAFWDEHELRFPEGVVHEDIPVTLPAHRRARSVAVVAAPVYRWRVREDGARSITQRRLELRVLRDRLDAIDAVRADFAADPALARAYDLSILADDLRLHLNLLGDASPEYRELFLARVRPLLDAVAPRRLRGLPAIDRVKWELVRDHRTEELLDVLAAPRPVPATRRRGRYVGTFPHAGAVRLGRGDEDLALALTLESAAVEDGRLRLRGRAQLGGVGAATPHGQELRLLATAPGRAAALLLRLPGQAGAVALPTAPTRRGDLGPELAWSGFHASLDPRALGTGDATYTISALARGAGLRRRRARFALAAPDLTGTLDLEGGADLAVRAHVGGDGSVTVSVRTRWARLQDVRRSGQELVLTGALRLAGGAPLGLELRRAADGRVLEAAAERSADGFTARLALPALAAVPGALGAGGAPDRWQLTLVAGSDRLPLAMPAAAAGVRWLAEGRELTLTRTLRGEASLLARRMAPERVVAEAAPDRRTELAHADPGTRR